MEKKTGIVVPLAALYTKDCEAVGDFPALKDFADFCKLCGFKVIQLLPVNDTGTQSSPYSGLSAFALHPLYIRLEALPEFQDALKSCKPFSSAYKTFKKEIKYSNRFDYDKVLNGKLKLLHLLYDHIEKQILKESKSIARENKNDSVVIGESQGSEVYKTFQHELIQFCQKNPWIENYAVYKNLKDSYMQASWKEWDENTRNLKKEQIKLRWNNRALKASHDFFVWVQMRAAEQFKDAADYVKKQGIILKGDIPILMNEDSADTWARRDYFCHEERAGSPPDGENPMGQSWGFPTYNWDALALNNYDWWKDRINLAANYYSAFRIDHILGFFRIWAVNERESTAYLGHTIPYASIGKSELEEAGFNEDRIKWLSQPHIPTSLVEDITWNHMDSTFILEKICDRVKDEELWTFKKEFKSDKDIYDAVFCDNEDWNNRIHQALAAKWRDRALIEITKDHFIPVYCYGNSTSWNSLNDGEKSKLGAIFARLKEKENQLWKEQALNVLTPITSASEMVPCAEDLGVNLQVMPEVLQKLNILSLKVIRWNRYWDRGGQPYQPFSEYPEMSVATTSVHDSPTLRQWWNNEKDSVRAYLSQWTSEKSSSPSLIENPFTFTEGDAFNPEIARFCLESAAHCNSAWYINPLQDYLYLDATYYLEKEDDERINVPGSVNQFNWTYRIPASVEDLIKNEELISKIKSVCKIHDEVKIGGEQ